MTEPCGFTRAMPCGGARAMHAKDACISRPEAGSLELGELERFSLNLFACAEVLVRAMSSSAGSEQSPFDSVT